jgi:hypothetical protein
MSSSHIRKINFFFQFYIWQIQPIVVYTFALKEYVLFRLISIFNIALSLKIEPIPLKDDPSRE